MPPGRPRVAPEPPVPQLFAVGRVCRVCELEQPMEQFRIDKRNGRHATICRSCERERVKEWAAQKTPEEQREMYKRWKAKQSPRDLLASSIRTTYGVSLEHIEALLVRQGGLCAIEGCDRELRHPLVEGSELRDTWRIDHCHTTGAVRGLLCQKCNTGIGIIGDTAQRLRNALAYLEAFENAQPRNRVHAA